ncbi:26493_t:CDS:1, partial [Dentiscutata erythropus]
GHHLCLPTIHGLNGVCPKEYWHQFVDILACEKLKISEEKSQVMMIKKDYEN